MSIATGSPVEEYVGRLRRALPGPHRRRADLLAEARDGLEDATEAYQGDGLDRAEAERRAVEDFGDLAEVVPAYRVELGIAQSRRTALLLFAVLIVQPVIWQDGVWAWTREPEAVSGLQQFLGTAIKAVGLLGIVGAVLAVLGTGWGLRLPWLRDRVIRGTAWLTFVSAASVGVLAVGMGVATPDVPGPALSGLGVVTGFVLLPLLVVATAARRCLRLS